MIHDIITDPKLLTIPAKHFNGTIDLALVMDLIDTAKDNQKYCLGLSANQIGRLEKYFVIRDGNSYKIIIDPMVINISPEIKSANESCLSLPGHSTKKRRHKWITIKYITLNEKLEPVIEKVKFKGLDARIIQHGLDHLKGVLV